MKHAKHLIIAVVFIAICHLPSAILHGQNIGINTTGVAATASALLDLNTGNTFINPNGKGLLVPNMALTGTSSANPVASPATSLLVYNTATVSDVTPGYYYWNGAAWVRFNTGGGGGSGWLLPGNAGITEPAQPATYGTSTIGVAENWLGTTDSKDLVFGTEGKERMRIYGHQGSGDYGVCIGKRPTSGFMPMNKSLLVGPMTGMTASIYIESTGGNSIITGGNSGGTGKLIINNNNVGCTPCGIVSVTEAGTVSLGNSYTSVSTVGVAGNMSVGAYNGYAAPSNGLLVSGQTFIGPSGAGSYDFVSKGMTSGGGSGRLVLNGSTTGIQSGIRLTSSTYDWGIGVGSTDYIFGIADNGGFTAGNLILQQYASTLGSGITLTPANLVGIGTNGPQASLNIQAAVPVAASRPTGGIFFTTPNNANVRGQIGLVQQTNEGNHYLLLQTVEDGAAWRPVVLARDGGNVGIGCTAPAYKLHVIGDIASSTAVRCPVAFVTGAITACSDIRYKKNIVPLQNSLSSVMKLQGVNYGWKKEEFPEKSFTDDIQIGFIAQEMEKIYPQVVVTDADGYKSVDYSRLTPILVEAIKEQQQMIDVLKTEIATIKTFLVENLCRIEAKK